MLIPRYPGGKRKLLKQIYDGDTYDCIVDPFAGGGAATVKLLPVVKRAFVADADPSVWAVWECWRKPHLHPHVKQIIRNIQTNTAANPALAWDLSKQDFEAANTRRPDLLAATSLAIRKLAFGGVIRFGASGKLNITWSKGQLPKFLSWQYRFPAQPEGTQINLGDSWQDAVSAFKSSDCKRAIALIDPPYFVPYTPGTSRRGNGGMTPAYPGHKPHAQDTFDLCVDCVSSLVSSNRVKRLVVANYWSSEMNEALTKIAEDAQLPIECIKVGRLDGINRSRAVSTQNVDCLWVIGHQRIKQLSLI